MTYSEQDFIEQHRESLNLKVFLIDKCLVIVSFFVVANVIIITLVRGTLGDVSPTFKSSSVAQLLVTSRRHDKEKHNITT